MDKAIIQLVDSRRCGGIETHIYQLSRELKARGYPVIVLFMADYGAHPLQQQLSEQAIPWAVAPTGYAGLAHWLRQHAGLVNTHGYKAGIIGRVLGKVLRLPVVSTWHAGEPGQGRMRLYQWLDHLTASLAPAMAVSQPIAQRLGRGVTRISNFVSPCRVATGGTQLAFVGRVSHEKGPDLFCQLAERSSAPALLFGDGPQRKLLAQRYKNQVEFAGEVAMTDQQWQRVGVLCITSRAEGMPLVALEAMARGIPVIAFAVGALPELIQHRQNGWLVPVGDMAGFYAAICEWQQLSRPAQKKLSAAAAATVQQQFSPARVMPSILDLYQRAAPELAQRSA